MYLEKYTIVTDEEFLDFEFISEGPNGKIHKAIRFRKMANDPAVYNLAFGDIDATTGNLNDLNVSNNGDRDKVLATVASSINDFSRHYGNPYIYAIGSTHARTRLYQMALSALLSEITVEHELYGYRNGNWMDFLKDVNYEAFLVRKK